MLVISRYPGQVITVGDDIEFEVIEVRGEKVKIGIRAPTEIPVHRKEVAMKISGEFTSPVCNLCGNAWHPMMVSGVPICSACRGKGKIGLGSFLRSSDQQSDGAEPQPVARDTRRQTHTGRR